MDSRGAGLIIPPSIDPFSAKNQQLDAATVQAILATIGVLDGGPKRRPGASRAATGRPAKSPAPGW